MGGYESEVVVEQPPPSVQDVYHSNTADLNGDGFVTLDEVVAMEQAGLSDDQLIERLRATGQMYQLTPGQEDYLRSHYVSDFVIQQMENMNRPAGGTYLNGGGMASPPGDSVISVPSPQAVPGPPGIPIQP
jgi:hypothetical protein